MAQPSASSSPPSHNPSSSRHPAGSLGLRPASPSFRPAIATTSDGEEDEPIYFPTRSSAERNWSEDGRYSKAARSQLRDEEGGEDGSDAEADLEGAELGASLLNGGKHADAHSARYEDGHAEEAAGGSADMVQGHGAGGRRAAGTSGGGTYWDRLANEATNTISTRALERSEGGTVKERKRAYWRAALLNIALICAWYTFSTLISIYNKWMFSPDRYNFSFPLFVTTWHMAMQFTLASLARKLFDERLVPRKPNGEKARPSGYDWMSKVVPCAVATALDIGLSNTSLKTITLTFYTMCKSSNLAFVLFFAFLFRLEVIRWSLIGIIALITVGVILMVAAETKFVLVGAIQVLTASAMGGLRWTLTQMLLDRDGMGMNNPIATIFWLAPVMGACLLLFSAIFEDWHAIFGEQNGWFSGLARTVTTVALITAPGILAFGMNLSEYALIQRTSVVTLSVAGIFKEVLTIMIASIVFGDELTPINVTGLCITLIGIGLYNYLKYRLITRGPSAFGRTDSSTNLTELSGSIRSRASSFVHSLRGNGRERTRATTTSRVGYDALPRGGADAAEGETSEGEQFVLFDRGEEDAVVLDGVGNAVGKAEAEAQRERERLRRIEEEADLDGWGSSGTRETGNGVVVR